MFKVVPDQLRISDGWVRCGQCDEVFDANVNLFSEPAAVEPEPVQTSMAPPEPPAQISPDPQWAASLKFVTDDRPDHPTPDLSEHSPTDQITGIDEAPAPNPQQEAAGIDDFLSQSPIALAHTPGADHETPPIESFDTSALDDLVGPAPRFTQSHATAIAPDEPKQPSFMHGGHRQTMWQRTSVRIALGLLGLLLSALLLLQIAVQERDRWTAYEPTTLPALAAICDVVGCSINPLRNIDAVVIDSSSFTKVRSDVYRLSVVLKNNGPVAVAPPALELTLTDMQDQSLIRRVLKPQDIGFKLATLEPGSEFSAALPISVNTPTSAERISGYRLLAFYP